MAKSAEPADLDLNTPNLIIPLAASYNSRDIVGYTNTITNATDQRKINSMYEPVVNALTGKSTLYLAKRPGTIINGFSFGADTQANYLTHPAAGEFGTTTNPWVFSTSGNDVRVSNSSTTVVIVTAAGYIPAYVDRTAVGATDTVVLQLKAAGAQTTWYSSTIATWTQITNGVFTGLTARGKMEHLDGFAFIMDNTNKAIYNSDLGSLANWSADAYIVKGIQQDEAQGLMRLGKQILAFGSETCEIFQNVGNAEGSVLQRIDNPFYKIGLPEETVLAGSGLTHYYTTIQNNLYFLGRETTGRTIGAFVYDGIQFNKISTLSIDKILNENLANSGALSSVNRILFGGRRAVAFALKVATSTTPQWLLYFPEWNEWFEWSSTVFKPVNSGEWFLGVVTNKLYRLASASSTYQDDGTNFTMTHQVQLPRTGPNQNRMSWFGVVGDTARSASSLGVSFSDDDYQTFSTARNIDMTSKTKLLRACGAYNERVVRLTHTGNLDCRLEKIVAKIT